jgi:murein peptide amidase A
MRSLWGKRVTLARREVCPRALPTLADSKGEEIVIQDPRGETGPLAAAASARPNNRWPIGLIVLAAAALLVPALASIHGRPVDAAKPAATAAPRPPLAASRVAAPASPTAAAIDLAQWCARLAPAVPGVDLPACRASGLQPGTGRSVHGTPLWTNDVLPAGAPKFRVLLLGGIHGDELASVTLAFDWIARSHGVQAQAMPRTTKTGKPTISDVAWRFVPLLNPDGLLHAPSTRVNAHGVDLNRNFPTADWARDAQPYWIRRTKRDPRRFPGLQPL